MCVCILWKKQNIKNQDVRDVGHQIHTLGLMKLLFVGPVDLQQNQKRKRRTKNEVQYNKERA